MPFPPRLLPLAALCFAPPASAGLVNFEDLSLPPDSFENGQNLSGGFASGGATFGNQYSTSVFGGVTYEFWSGFSYSNVNDPTTPGFGNQYAAITGVDRDAGGSVYGIGGGYADLPVTNAADLASAGLPWFELPSGAALQGMYVTNTTYAYDAMQNGDGFAKEFGGPTGSDPDFFRLNAYGVDESGDLLAAGPAEFYLADYRFADETQDYVVDTWSYFDLSGLSGARRVYFDLDSSDFDPMFGMNTPGYFAVDGIAYDVAAVPEPGTGLLVLLAAGGGVVVRRRRGLGRKTNDV